MAAAGHSWPRKPVVVKLGQAGSQTAPGTVAPTWPGHSDARFQVPGFCARSRAVATAPGFVVEAITGWMNSTRFDEPAPQNVAFQLFV